MKRILVCLLSNLFLTLTLRAEPQPLPPERLVQKLAFVLTGRAALPGEIEKFKSDLQATPDAFISSYRALVERYMKTPAFAQRIQVLHQMWWHVPLELSARHAAYVVTQDLPYEEIYTRNYLYLNAEDTGFYQALSAGTLGDLPTQPGPPVRVLISPEEKRFRGFFGSPDFLITYPDTASNVNRKRSSQVFRIAFCETLKNPVTEELGRMNEDEHGSSPDCVGCHRRLDPMARFFDQWRPAQLFDPLPYDASQPSQGSVFLGGTLGMDKRFEGFADSDLGAIVVKQPEFGACVSKLAWQLVYGREVPIDAETDIQLQQQYQTSKRFKTLVTSALLHPYFWSDRQVPTLTYREIRPLLQNCGSCHARSELTTFQPDVYPFLEAPADNVQLLKKIWTAINRWAGAKPMPLPPQPKLPQESLDSIRVWLENGALNDAGSRTLNDEEIEEILQ